MKLYTIFTGGTIGSKVTEHTVISPSASMPYRLLDMCLEKGGADCEFIVEEPYQILSENLSATFLLALIRSIRQGLENADLDGMIVTHGTDTLQYTAAILGYVFENARIPIVIVSSNYVLDDERANGFTNFQYALEFIRGRYGQGVFVSYCNQGAAPTIHCATRLQVSLPFSDNVYSVAGAWLGQFTSVGNEVGRTYVPHRKADYKKSKESPFAAIENLHLDDEANSILRIAPYPGMAYPKLMAETKVILHESFHSGTIGISEALKEFAMHAKEANIPIYLTGLSMHGAQYETVEQYRALGIIPLKRSSVISQYCKLWLIVSNCLDLKNVMDMCIAGDHIE